MTLKKLDSAAQLGIGIVTTDPDRDLKPLLASVFQPSLVKAIVVVNNGGTHTDVGTPWASAFTKAGIYIHNIYTFDKSLPLSRGLAEDQLHRSGCNQFLITDDDIVFDGLFLPTASNWLNRKDYLQWVVGGGVRNGWPQGNTIDSDEDYLAWFDGDEVTPRGHVAACTAMYGSGLVGLWDQVHSAGLTFAGEDRAWMRLAYERKAHFRCLGFVGLHLPPTPPRLYSEDDMKDYQEFLAARKSPQ